MCAHVARRIHEAGGLEDDIVVGWESLNEPNPGMVGHPDLTTLPTSQPLKKGTSPTAWQAMLTGMGRACEIETWDVGGMGPHRVGRKLVDPRGESAWLPAGYDDSRYGWVRDPGWRLGQCVWAMHGVWDPATDTLLDRAYFARQPGTGMAIDHQLFNDTYFMAQYRGWRDRIRAVHRRAILVLQGPTLQPPPRIIGTADDDANMAYAPHWYDGITLMTKHFNRTWNVDVVGILRGRYWSPVFAIRVGETAIRNCFRDQVATLRREAKEMMGKHPVIMTEFGIPYDMDDRAAYRTGNYAAQLAAMDANYYAVEGSGLEGHCLWVYAPGNDHRRGDQWNGEDLSITSVDDKPLPIGGGGQQEQQPQQEEEQQQQQLITPKNLERTLARPSISSDPPSRPASLVVETHLAEAPSVPGFRAAEAFVRPSPVVVAGDIVSYGFDLRSCTFNLSITGMTTTTTTASRLGGEAAVPTVVYLPEYHFPRDGCEVFVSSGKWELRHDGNDDIDDSINASVDVAVAMQAQVQKLVWWHPGGAQTLTVTGSVRRHDQVVSGSAEELGYLEQCWQAGGGTCGVM